MIFLGNTWQTGIDLDFLRRESETTAKDGKSEIVSRFPNWLFEGNSWIGFHGPPRIVERQRGTPITVKRDITAEVENDPHETVRLEPSTNPLPEADCVRRLHDLVLGADGKAGRYASKNPKADQRFVQMVETGEIPGVSTAP